MRLGDDPLANALVQWPAYHGREQLARLRVRQSFELQLRQPGQRVELARLTHGEYEDDRLRLEAPGYEGEHL